MNRVCARAREMLKPFGKKTNTAKRVLKVLAVPLAACALLFGATSALADQAVPFSNHTVKTVNPTGTTVNLFDYWVVDGANDSSANINIDNSNNNTGINKDHQLKFNGGAGTGINKWTGKSGTGGFGRLSFVKNTLVNGYPEIDGAYASYNTHGTYEDESLDYLFNSASQANENDKQDGKAVYNNVQGLFQLKKGYYVYDSYGSDGSDGNYAVYNLTTNSFNVYNKAGVYKGDASSETNLGQFFPFDSAKKVFTDNGNGLSPNSVIDGDNSTLNHHFGMSMTTEFVQPAGGKTTDNKDMVFEFSGDDDVWVYIDGVLVGDLGGIHEKATLEIDFATGEVKVGHVDGANGTKKEIENTNIKAKFEAAGVDTTNFSGNTFLGSTKHTLSFFYLERGAGASNMSLKFNLTTLPSSEVAKVDQNGEAVNDATFGLYRSDGPDYDWNTGELVARGTTENGGQLILRKLKPGDSEPSDSVLSFDEEHNKNHCDYFVLKEENLPAGYRSSLTSSTTATPGELHLQYKPAAATGSGGVVVAPQTTVETADGDQWTGSRMWLNGGYLAAKETISLHKDTQDNKGHVISSGTTFAVVLKRTDENKSDTDENAWTAVTGNPLKGYKLCSKHGIEGAVEAARSADTSVFGVNTNGDYEVTVRSLPGDIEKYAAMMADMSKAEYTVAVYHTTAPSLAGATIGNTSMVKYQTINRQFSTVIHLTNVQNRLFVQKVDDLGRPVNDAKFELYQAKDVIGDSPSTYAIKPGAEPYDTVKANDATYPYEIKGAACFPLDSVNHKPLIKGTYYLRESVSPDGYEINNTITKVIVDDSGVYVDAGEKGDGVLSVSGPGSLIASLAQFGSPDSIDNTLTHIKGMLQSTTGVDAKGNLTWGQVKPSLADVHMRYDKATQGTKTILRYVEDCGERDGKLATIYADTGINRMALYQEDDSKYIDDTSKTRTNLGTLQLNHLFTTATAVQYTDCRVARLQVTKTVTADTGLTAPTKDAKGNDLTFTFKFTLPYSEEGYETRVFDANGMPVGNSFKLKNGGTHSIKAGQTIRVYDLKQGDKYSVSELTTKGEASSGDVLASIVNTVTGSAEESVLPAGFSLVSRKVGGEEQSGTGNTIEGKIVALVDGQIPADNTLEFTNNYSVISVPVEKRWVGPAAKKATVRLLADGKDAGQSIELNESNGWKGSFEGLAKYSKSGSEVSYTVAEDAVEGYSSKVSGDAEHGFTVTNTSTAKVSVPVEKRWVGPAAKKATVRLLADGKDAGQSIELNESNGWKGSFEGLAKYSKSGSEVSYTVAEDAVEGYSSKVSGDAEHGFTVTNTSTAKVDYSARAGVRLSKTLSGRAMEAGQFAFTVTADAETAARLGLKTDKDAYAVAAADDGKADLVDLIGGAAESDVKFTDADAGKTYSFTVTETKLGGEGYTNDTAPRTVTIAPAYDAATGKLTVTTTVAKDGVEVARGEVSTADDATATPAPVTVAFENSYEATGTLGGEGNVAINATKTLTGRAAAAGEFSFSVRDARGNAVATATNRASGDGEAAGLAFSPIAYTTDALERMVADGIATRAADGSWAIPYTVSEDGTDRLPAGVTATASSFDITVKVTDNGKGGLDVAVAYPEGSDGTLSFVNGYGTNEATVDLAGTKTLALGQAGLGLTQADIAGKYTFKIAPLDGAPAPVDASGKTVTEATNDAAGNVELGHVTFRQPSDLDDVEIDGGGLRTKTFAYRVSESGSVDGVVNDATATRTFTVKVVEDTNAGTLVAEVLPAEGTPEGKGAFEFTNTYGVNQTSSSVTDQIKVSKKLKGRDLAEGEFEFHLVELAADGGESVAATGRNAADGTVALGPVTYTAPGTHGYELREVAGTAGGVTYDRATYCVRTTVTDAKNGTLAVKHELADAEGNAAGDDSVTFTNGYEAAPVTLKLGAAKVLKGAELKAGQFSFELKGRDGKVMSTAKNAADGSVTFDALTFKQAGTYTFTVGEVDDGQAHVTYDKAVHKIVVAVSDEAADGTRTGYLSAKVSYEGDANLPPVFTNSYAEEPGAPGTPENPGTPGGGSDGGSDNGSGSGSSGDGSKGGMPDTGDRSLPVEALAAMAGIGALAVAGGAVLYRRRR